MEKNSAISFGLRNEIARTIEDQLSSLNDQYYPSDDSFNQVRR
jgi:hypothetical protein